MFTDKTVIGAPHMKLPAGKLSMKPVISDKGYSIGYLRDLIIDETSGRILYLLCEPPGESDESYTQSIESIPKTSEGLLLIPASAVKSISGMILIEERVLRIFLMKKGVKSMQQIED